MVNGDANKLNVYEIKEKLYMLKDIRYSEIQHKVCILIDTSLSKNDKLQLFHNENTYKNYCFDSLYPIEDDKVYKQGKIYTLTIRTTDIVLAKHFNEKLVNEYSNDFKALTSEIKIIPKKHIVRLYSITPAILKTDRGYWKNNMTVDDFEKRLKSNLIKKYNTIMNLKIDEDFNLFTSIEFKNRKPVSTAYKNINLLGDKISLEIDDNPKAQELVYMALGTGILEANSRGFGYVNYRWL